MNRLAFNRGYLCGAMDRVADGGVEWREYIMSALVDLKILWLDPTNKPISLGIEDIENRQHRHFAKQKGDFDAVCLEMRQIRSVDLRMVDIADFMVVNIDVSVHACGTYEELFWANRMMKPILVRCAQGKRDAPDWLFGTLPHRLIFSTWDEVIAYLRHVAKDEHVDHLKRWRFFNFTGE
jgi:hypothetical protein